MTKDEYRAAAERLGRSIAGAQTGIHIELDIAAAQSQHYASGRRVIPPHIAQRIAYWLKTGISPKDIAP